MRLWRWQKMKGMQAISTDNVIIDNDSKDEKLEVTTTVLGERLQALERAVDQQQTTVLEKCLEAYQNAALHYSAQSSHRAQSPVRVLSVGYPWRLIKKIAHEIKIHIMHKFNYKDTLAWCIVLQGLLQIIIETETKHKRAVIKNDKEELIDLIGKASRYLDSKKPYGFAIKHQLSLCHEALVSMDDTDSIKDNLYCHDSEMLVEFLKIMAAPPYGILRLLYQAKNIPSGWYPIIIQIYRLARQTPISIHLINRLQQILSEQKDWQVIYAGIVLLGQLGRESQEESIKEEIIEGRQSFGLKHYEGYYGFWKKSCCDKKNAQIRSRAKQEIQSTERQIEFPDGYQRIDLEVDDAPLLPLLAALAR